ASRRAKDDLTRRRESKRWRLEIDDPPEQLFVFDSRFDAYERVRMTREGRINHFPVARGEMDSCQRQHLCFLGAHVAIMESRISSSCGGKCRKLRRVALLVMVKRLLEGSDFFGAHFVFVLELCQQRNRIRMSEAQQPKQVLILFRMMEALAEHVDVMNHCGEHIEIRLRAGVAHLADEEEHAVKHRR